MSRASTLLVVALASSACDNRQAFHEPDPTLARMLEQRRADAYGATSAFANGQVMRTPPPGTIPHDDDQDEPAPLVTLSLLTLGKSRFDVTCATCHGVAADGESVVATKMEVRRPPSLHDERYRALSREQMFVIVTDGYGLMPSYAAMLSRRERWAVVAWLQALQLSRRVPVSELTPAMRAELAKEAP